MVNWKSKYLAMKLKYINSKQKGGMFPGEEDGLDVLAQYYVDDLNDFLTNHMPMIIRRDVYTYNLLKIKFNKIVNAANGDVNLMKKLGKFQVIKDVEKSIRNYFSGVDLQDADLRHAHLAGANTEGALYNDNTRFPE